MFKHIIKKRPIKMFNYIYLKKPNLTEISKFVGYQNLQVRKMVDSFIEQKLLVEIEKGSTREKNVDLTQKGNALRILLNEIESISKDKIRINKIKTLSKKDNKNESVWRNGFERRF